MGLFVEGAHRSICRTLHQWWSKHRQASLEDIAQKAESFTDLPRNNLITDRPGTVNKEERQTYRANKNRVSQCRHVTIVRCPSPPRFLRCSAAPSSTSSSAFNVTVVSITDLLAAVECGELDLDDNTSMDSTPFCRVF